MCSHCFLSSQDREQDLWNQQKERKYTTTTWGQQGTKGQGKEN